VITNGLPDVQARKAQALSLGGLVDAIVYANECGTRIGKPAIEPFQAVLDRLGTMAAACVFVGNDPWCDVMGARQAGFHTILLCRHEYGRLLAPACEPDVRVHAMDEVIVAAERIWRGDMVDAV
jgi:putative hydrolase of the HAD superfamily